MSLDELEKKIQRLLDEYQLGKGTTLAGNEVLKLLERQKQRVIDSLNDYYDSLL